MAAVTLDYDKSLFGTLRLSPTEFAHEVKVASAVQWYFEEMVSQEKAAKLAGLSRIEFLEELHRRRIPACQATMEELKEEIHGD